MKNFFYLLLIVIGLASCKSTSTSASKESYTKKSSKMIANLIETAKENLGVKYKYAGTTKAGFDCSGLVYSTFQSESISLPRSSYQQAMIGKIIPIKKAEKGDLIFFKTNGSSRINHVGMIIEITNGEIKFIHSSTYKGVIISSMNNDYYIKTFIQVNRIIN